jgi:hypothetical protein
MSLDLLHPWYTVPLLLLGWAMFFYGGLRLSGAVGRGHPRRHLVGGVALTLGLIFVAHACGYVG